MAYFAVVKISDAQGNVVELSDVSDTLQAILASLRRIEILLGQIADAEMNEGDGQITK